MTLEDILNQIRQLNELNNVDVTVIGNSTLSVPIYAVHIGNYDGDQFIIEGGIHAREYASTLLIIELIKYLYNKIDQFGIYFIPLVNPDGVKLVLEGLDPNLPQETKDFLLSVNNNSTDFSQWKANINAVDLNVNFDALWGGGAQNVRYPSPGNFIGYETNSEPEVKALIDFTIFVNPILTISYHTKGEVIYYGFETLTQDELARDTYIVNELARVTGYEPILTRFSTGGYSDWVSLNLKVPAYTIEIGNPKLPHPIGLDQIPIIFEQNKDVPITAYLALNTYNLG
jgi:g-D-glutamyl-meso-diaminopimelate peptidase